MAAAWSGSHADGVEQVPPQEAAALGQVILVASRLDAYCRAAAWYLLVAVGEVPDADGSAPPPADAAAPFSRYREVLKLPVRDYILRRVQVRQFRHYLPPCGDSPSGPILSGIRTYGEVRFSNGLNT